MPVLSDLLADEPESVALEYAGATMTRGELLETSGRVAAGLQALGITRGDRVALWLPNCPAWLVLAFACARLGAIAVSVNTRFRAHEVGDIVGRAGCVALALWPDFRAIDFAGILADVTPQALGTLRHVIICADGDAASGCSALPAVPRVSYASLSTFAPQAGEQAAADDRCILFTTSGTTRAPKFVCHDQQTVLRHAEEAAAALELLPGRSLVLQALPLCGVFGYTQAMAALAARVPMLMMPVFEAETAASWVIERGVTHMNGVDDMIDRMLAARAEARPFPSLRAFGYAAFNPALEDIVQRAEARGVIVHGLYGMSECHALFALQPLTLPAAERGKGGGLPVSAEAAVRVRDPDSGALLPPGVAGELEIRGPSLFREYFGDAEATRAAFTDDGYLRTGDLALLEGDGRFCYVARMGDVLRLGGFLVSPLEIEAVIDDHADIAASQVVAVPVEGRVQPVAFAIAAQGGFDEQAVIAACRARLAAYKVPCRVFAIEAFPTTASANGTKIQKSRLRALASEKLAPASPA